MLCMCLFTVPHQAVTDFLIKPDKSAPGADSRASCAALSPKCCQHTSGCIATQLYSLLGALCSLQPAAACYALVSVLAAAISASPEHHPDQPFGTWASQHRLFQVSMHNLLLAAGCGTCSARASSSLSSPHLPCSPAPSPSASLFSNCCLTLPLLYVPHTST
jgi:hypothetical protein